VGKKPKTQFPAKKESHNSPIKKGGGKSDVKKVKGIKERSTNITEKKKRGSRQGKTSATQGDVDTKGG